MHPVAAAAMIGGLGESMHTLAHACCVRPSAHAPAAAAALLALAGCRAPEPFVANVDATQIVRQNSADAFAALFDRQRDAGALRAFAAAAAAAQNRAELTAAWQSVPALARAGRDFLQQHVYELAEREHRWPHDAPAAELERAFADGVRAAVTDFLGTR